MPHPELFLSIHGTRVRFSPDGGWIANDGMMARHLNNVTAEWTTKKSHAPTVADAEAIARAEYKEAVQKWTEPAAKPASGKTEVPGTGSN